MFVNNSSSTNNFLRVITYINIRLSFFYFFLYKDIYNHRDILLVFFFNKNNVFFLIDIYSDSSQSALKYLKDTEVNIHNVLIMTGNFNISRDLKKYRLTRSLENWKQFKKKIKSTKYSFFNQKIQKILNKKEGL